jgi:hypothetical protein
LKGSCLEIRYYIYTNRWQTLTNQNLVKRN